MGTYSPGWAVKPILTGFFGSLGAVNKELTGTSQKPKLQEKEFIMGTKGNRTIVEERIIELTRKKMKEDPNLTWNEAMNIVSKQNRRLADRYLLIGRGVPIPLEEELRAAGFEAESPKDSPDPEDPEIKICKMIAKKISEDPDLTYGDAMNKVARENPDIFKEYLQWCRTKKIYP